MYSSIKSIKKEIKTLVTIRRSSEESSFKFSLPNILYLLRPCQKILQSPPRPLTHNEEKWMLLKGQGLVQQVTNVPFCNTFTFDKLSLGVWAKGSRCNWSHDESKVLLTIIPWAAFPRHCSPGLSTCHAHFVLHHIVTQSKANEQGSNTSAHIQVFCRWWINSIFIWHTHFLFFYRNNTVHVWET